MDISTRLIRRVARTIDDYAMFCPADSVLASVSGGPDSMAMLHLLIGLVPIYKIRITVAHLNHGWRPEAEAETDLVRRYAAQLALPFHAGQVAIDKTAGDLEERAREARYAWLQNLADECGCRKIALGHQAEDNAEAVLMHLLRGSGIRGLSGIPPVRGGRIVRPLIRLRRGEILKYLVENKIPFAWDGSNTDTRFTRNRVRHHLIPLLERDYNPNIVETLARNAAGFWHEDQWRTAVTDEAWRAVVAGNDQDCLELSAVALAGLHSAAQRRLLREAIRRFHGTLRRISAEHIEKLLALLPESKTGKRLSMPGFEVMRTLAGLRFHHEKDCNRGPHAAYWYELKNAGSLPRRIDLPESGGRLTFSLAACPEADELSRRDVRVAWFDPDQIIFPLIIRTWRPGDRITLAGGTRKIKKIFNEAHIAEGRRHRTPLIESGGRIIWLAGVRRSVWALLSEKTGLALRVTWLPPAAE